MCQTAPPTLCACSRRAGRRRPTRPRTSTRRVGDSSTRTESVPSLNPLEPFSQAREIVDEDGWAALFVRGLGTRLLVNALQAALFTVLWKTIEDVLVNGGGPGWLTFAAAGSPGL